MGDIFVYRKDCDDFDTLGECGPLDCISAKFTEVTNGKSELIIEHPIDDLGKWSFLIEDYILEADIPVRTTPEIDDEGLIVTQTETWKIKWGATKNERGVFNKESGGKRLWTEHYWKDQKNNIRTTVCVVDKGSNRYKIKTNKGYGYISINAIEDQVVNEPLFTEPEAIETLVPAWSVRTQRFRMYAPVVGEDKVTVTARHITYDLLGNSTTFDPWRTHPNWSSTKDYVVGAVVLYDKIIYYCIAACKNIRPTTANNVSWTPNPTCGVALAKIKNNCIKPHDFKMQTNIANQRVFTDDWIDISPIEALLATDKGLVDIWKADLIRDNEEIKILDEAGLNRGVRIEYAKNLVSVKVSIDTTSLITSIRPIGQTKKGKPLYLAAGDYDIDGQTITIDSSLTVSSPHESEYAIPHVFVYDLGTAAKARDTDPDSSGILEARKKMIKACLDLFKDEECDIPLLSLSVEFVNLGDTEEGRQYRQLENLYLFDRVSVWHPRIGVDVLTSVTRIEFDPLLEKFISIELGPARQHTSDKKIPSWKLPPAQKVAYQAVDTGAFTENVETDLDMTNNASVAAVAQLYVKNAWITGEQVFKYASGAINPDPLSISITANLQNVLMGQWEYKNFDGNWTLYPTGITGPELVISPNHDVWVNNVCTIRLVTDDPNINDTFCLYKIYDGLPGIQGGTGERGSDGSPGQNAPIAFLSNENVTFSGNSNGQVAATTVDGTVVAYIGTTKVTPTIGVITGAPSGMHVTSGSVVDNELSLIIAIDDNSTLGQSGPISGVVSIPITYPVVTTLRITWSKVNSGVPGVNAKLIALAASAQVFSVSALGNVSPASLSIVGSAQNTAITTWEYSVDGATFSSSLPTGITRTGDTVSVTGLTMAAKTIAIRASDGTYSDTITIAKVADGAPGATGATGSRGADGTNGTNGLNGADAYTVLLTNESHVFPGDVANAVAGSTYFDILAFKGASQIAATIGDITGHTTGLTTEITGNGTTAAKVTVNATTNLVAAGVLTIPITVDGKTFPRKFSYTIGFKGLDGTPGADGQNGTNGSDAIYLTFNSTGGDVFKNAVGSTFLACRVWKNGAELDPAKTTLIVQTFPTTDLSEGMFCYKYDPSGPSMFLYRYDGTTWIGITSESPYKHVYSYTWRRRDKSGNLLDGGEVFALGKIIYFDGDDVDEKTTFICEVS